MFTQKKKQIKVLLFSIMLCLIIGIFCSINVNGFDISFAKTDKINNKIEINNVNVDTERNEKEQIISGAYMYDDVKISIDEFSDVKYIQNKKYFLDSPKHAPNDDNYNVGGVCTTVAMQMLLGYHNYYSDRRLIPAEFLPEKYGELDAFPIDEDESSNDSEKIGTADSLFDELYNFSLWPEFPVLGQNVINIAGAAEIFISENAPDIENNVFIEAREFSEETAINEINNNRPIILGYEPVFSGASTYHVMVAYGYAKLDGKLGFLVHSGYGSTKTQVWVPSSWFGFQIKMEVFHTHNFVDTGENFARLGYEKDFRILHCDTCGVSVLDKLYSIDASKNKIVSLNYPINESSIAIPRKLYSVYINEIGDNVFENLSDLKEIIIYDDILKIGDNAFKNCSNLKNIIKKDCKEFKIVYIGNNAFENCQSLSGTYMFSEIENIGDNAFKNCVSLNGISQAYKLQYIGNEAFYNCSNLTDITLPTTLTYIGEKAFLLCNNLNIEVDNSNPNYSAQDNILYNKDKTQILASGKITASIDIPDTVNQIGSYAFASNNNLKNIHFNKPIIIGISAFEDCENLENVYFYSINTPQLDSNAFANDEFNLYVPYNYQSDYRDVFADYSLNIDSLEMQVKFVNDGQQLDTKNVKYGSLIDYDTIPTKVGYTFEGWFDANGVKYIDADGKGVKLVDKREDFVLESHWSIKSYKIKINGNGFVTWLGPNGLSEEECEIEYGTIISAINLIAEFKATEQGYKEGYIFDHFEYDNQKLNWSSIPDLGADGIEIEITPQWIKEIHTIYFNTLCSTTIAEITKQYGESIKIPTGLTNKGYHFAGWYQNSSYSGAEVDWATMPDLTPKTANNTYKEAQNNGSIQLYAKWEQISYTIKYNANGGTGSMASSQHFYHEAKELSECKFSKYGYIFIGWSRTNNNKKEFDNNQVVKGLTEESSITLYACWEPIEISIMFFAATNNSNGDLNYFADEPFNYYTLKFGESCEQTPKNYDGYKFVKWQVDVPVTYSVSGNKIKVTCDYDPVTVSVILITAIYQKDECLAEGSLITLADGTQKAVEDLTGEEELLVWNLFTGEFDKAPIIFIDSHPEKYYEVINLYFSDGTIVKVIDEHAFWDFNLNKYVFLRKDAAKYIGHWYNKQAEDENGNMTYTKVQLTDVVVQEEYTTAWSPVTYGHLCYYVNGMLSMPGSTTGLINIFEVDSQTMSIDKDAYQEDIEKYGLFTYEEFNAICPMPKEIFDAFGCQYFKVSMGKGLITWGEIEALVARYSKFWN